MEVKSGELPMDDQAIINLFGNFLLDLNDFKFLIEKRPLLAHYTRSVCWNRL